MIDPLNQLFPQKQRFHFGTMLFLCNFIVNELRPEINLDLNLRKPHNPISCQKSHRILPRPGLSPWRWHHAGCTKKANLHEVGFFWNKIRYLLPIFLSGIFYQVFHLHPNQSSGIFNLMNHNLLNHIIYQMNHFWIIINHFRIIYQVNHFSS